MKKIIVFQVFFYVFILSMIYSCLGTKTAQYYYEKGEAESAFTDYYKAINSYTVNITNAVVGSILYTDANVQ